ncbi:MFS family permease [Sphingomonas sp. SORGH_AS802]|uniref:MFS transporter n=1 Tax=unclassified Sphingomonas TaxID=196159 RepID=UPI002854C551|nr:MULTISPECIES: MFS transporter [unclassified Sphingomonas]MDR6126134.1 MFS family permease [Sphingomonas sp. SORGH_AS_0438]MDR6136020.1 MFS family permease [Sphingomonas sp. SORGH_AS_0802]
MTAAALFGRARRFLTEEDWTFAPHERPAMPGSPGSPDHPTGRRIAYGAISILVGLTAGLGNALVSANTYTLQGALGLDPAEIAWLPTVYVMSNVSINLLLIKFRQQFGLRPFALLFVGLYVALTLAHLFVHDFWSAIVVRASSGMAAAALSSLGLYYMMQALPAKWRLKAVVIGIGVPQCATPLARLFSPELLAMSQWRTLYLFELGLALLSLAAVAALRLPPTTRQRAFEPLDFVTFTLYAGAMALFSAVLGLGRIVWWTNAAWIGWSLIGAIPLLAAALWIEHHRVNPLLNTRWLASADIVRFAIVTLMARIVLAEQSFAAVGLLTTLGQNNDQLGPFFTIIFLASVAGVVLSAVTLDVERLAHPIMLAVGLVAVAAWMDAQSTSLTRAPELYVTQALIAFSATFFLGPALLFGMTRALKEGAGHIISFIALFGIINSVGSLAGTALLGTYQVVREKANSAAIVDAVDPTNPLVMQRLQAGGAAVGRVVGDPGLRSAEGGALLSQAATREANVLAYDDVFRLVAVMAAATFLYLLFLLLRRTRRARQAARLAMEQGA